MQTVTEIITKAKEYMNNLVNELKGLNANQKKNMRFICEGLIHTKLNMPIYEKRNPKLLAAAIVYIAALKNKLEVTQRELASITKTTQRTIYNHYKIILNNDLQAIKRPSRIPL